MKEERIYRCPADPQQGAAVRAIYYPRDTRIMTSYIMNGSVCGYGRRPYNTSTRLWDTYRLSQFRQGDFVFWEGDENLNNFGDWWDGANSPNQGISRRHYGENMVGRVDGGGERLSWDEYRAEERKSSKNRLWNVPDSSSGR